LLISSQSFMTPSKPSNTIMVVSFIMPPPTHSLPPLAYFYGCPVHTTLRRTVKPSASFTQPII
jgi:hypothetical protein